MVFSYIGFLSHFIFRFLFDAKACVSPLVKGLITIMSSSKHNLLQHPLY
jgi:hypothetical protein